MHRRASQIAVHYVEHGAGRPVLVLRSAEDVLGTLLDLAAEAADGSAHLLIEQPALLRALVGEWLARVERST